MIDWMDQVLHRTGNVSIWRRENRIRNYSKTKQKEYHEQDSSRYKKAMPQILNTFKKIEKTL